VVDWFAFALLVLITAGLLPVKQKWTNLAIMGMALAQKSLQMRVM
jgi:hypothetical protein